MDFLLTGNIKKTDTSGNIYDTTSLPNSSGSEATFRVRSEGGFQPTLPNSSGSEATFRVRSEGGFQPTLPYSYIFNTKQRHIQRIIVIFS